MSASETIPQQVVPTTIFELERVDMYGKYMLSAAPDIVFILRSMIKRGCMATAYFDQGRSFFLTWLLAIGSDEQSLILDIANDQAVNRAAYNASCLILTANLDNVKIQFALTGLKETSFEGRPAFQAEIPSTLLRLQRREYFRLELSAGDHLHCEIPASDGDQPSPGLDLLLLDISGGGVSLKVPTDMARHFETGRLHANCRLRIPDEAPIVANLSVRSTFNVTTRSGQQYLRAGCEFVNLPGARLTTIQRYITRVERQRKAREAGLE